MGNADATRVAILYSLLVVMLFSSAGASCAGAAHPAERSSFALKDGQRQDRRRIKQESGPFDVIVYFN
jgi:hypothetical protein